MILSLKETNVLFIAITRPIGFRSTKITSNNAVTLQMVQPFWFNV